MVIATQNPVGAAGTQLLPEAQLDRFMVRLKMGYPDFASQVSILRDRLAENPLEHVRQIVDCETVRQMQGAIVSVQVAESILAYITHLAEASRTHPLVQMGVSPRGALAVLKMAQARAYLDGRTYVIPEDVARVYVDVTAHRMILSPKAKAAGDTQQSVALEVLQGIRMPTAGR